ncbi:MAG: Mur ligase family protein [Spirochaetes bacterium]|nr:Mur ligase family protein [Spirochaetota bacterium]
MNDIYYNKTLDWIYSFTNLEINRSKDKIEDNYKLKKIENILNYFGNPQKGKFIVHITGTKGKGSVSYILNKIFIKNGYKVGLYTSPHIYEVTERIKVNDKEIPQEKFIFYANEIKKYVDTIKSKELIPTFFDILTSIAFLYFNDEKCDIWVVEVGIGGKYDSTNIVDSSLSIITSISKDHTEILGNTLEKIAMQKVGIVKKDKPLVTGRLIKKIYKVIENETKRNNSEFIYSPDYYQIKIDDFIIKNNENKLENGPSELNKNIKNHFYISDYPYILQKFKVINKNKDKIINKYSFNSSLIGTFQLNNFSVVFSAVDILNRYYNLGIKIDLELFEKIFYPGRFNLFKVFYNGKRMNLIVDGAHNGDSAKQFSKTVEILFQKGILEGNNNLLVVGMMADKDHQGILKEIIFHGNTIFFIEPDMYKDCRIENYESIYLKIKHDTQKYLKIKSDFNIDSEEIIVDENQNLHKMNPYKVNFINSIINLYSLTNKVLPDNIYFTGSLYLASIVLKDIQKVKNIKEIQY